MIRVLLVDDQPLVRAGLRRILRPRAGFEVVGECDDGDQVEEAVTATRPDVVVMDMRMKRVDGAEATRRLRAREGSPPVLVLTTFDEDEVLSAALRPPDPSLTPRELEVLKLVGRGLANSEIARELYISEVTVKAHLGHVLTKLGLRDRAAAIVYAFDTGLASPGR